MEAEERIEPNATETTRCSRHRRGSSHDMKHWNVSAQTTRQHVHSSGRHHHHALRVQVLKPRITKLEHLEAKMASIEVSLSNALEEQTVPRTVASVPQSEENVVYSNVAVTGDRLQQFVDEIKQLRGRLQEKDAVIGALREQTTRLLSVTLQTEDNNNVHDDTPALADKNSTEQLIREGRLQQLQSLIENKISIVKDIRLQLESLEVNDLDSRIRQAELECMLEREEMNILSFQHEQVNLQSASRGFDPETDNFQWTTADVVTVYSIVSGSQCTNLVAVEIAYDFQSPCFYVTAHHSGKGLFVQWAQDSTKMKKGDRLLEVNGQIVAGCGKEEFLDVLRSTSSQLRIVVLRDTPMLPIRKVNREVECLKEEMSSVINKLDTKIKENKELRLAIQKSQRDSQMYVEESQRLKHRTLYLEEQISELSRLTTRSTFSAGPADDDGRAARLEPSVVAGDVGIGIARRMNSSLVRSHLVTETDKLSIQASCSRHILQVPVPFVVDPSFEQSSSNPKAGGGTTTNLYSNVPLCTSKAVQFIERQSASCSRPCALSTDSDSGNYSGDSMDDTFSIPQLCACDDCCDSSCPQPCRRHALASTAGKSFQPGRDSNHHEYVNLIQKHMRETVAFGTVSLQHCNKNVNRLKDASANKSSVTLNSSVDPRGVEASGDANSRPKWILQKSDCHGGFVTEIASHSGGYSHFGHEEWC